MRYIGNKTKLLPFLRETIAKLGISPGVAHDAFAGTAAVGRELKATGWHVHSSDLMTYSYVMQRAYVVASSVDNARAAAMAEELTTASPTNGFFARNFGPIGGRMYFTDDNARKIDAARTVLHGWHRNNLIDDDTFYVLLAAVIEGADRVANTAGVYAAFIKRWQPNALRPFTVVAEPTIPAVASGAAHQADAEHVARSLGPIDLLYIDPPYNSRQYAGYYHVPELIARGWFDDAVALRGKTGLIDDDDQRSMWCSRRNAPIALQRLLASTGAVHVLVSYNSEGVIRDGDVRSILREAAIDRRVRRFTRRYKRYRADSDREGRRYKGDEVRELLYYARLR